MAYYLALFNIELNTLYIPLHIYGANFSMFKTAKKQKQKQPKNIYI